MTSEADGITVRPPRADGQYQRTPTKRSRKSATAQAVPSLLHCPLPAGKATVLPTRNTRFRAVLITKPSIGIFTASIPASRAASQSPMKMAGWSDGVAFLTRSSSAPLLSRITSINSSTRRSSFGLGAGSATQTTARARPSRTTSTGGWAGAFFQVTGGRSRGLSSACEIQDIPASRRGIMAAHGSREVVGRFISPALFGVSSAQRWGRREIHDTRIADPRYRAARLRSVRNL